MCWNAAVSLNTFLFSSFVLLLIIYNNTYTQYKIKQLDIWSYLFFCSFIFMQLIEYFIWNGYNLSLLATLLLFSQPYFSLMMMKSKIKYNLIAFYFVIIIPILIYNFFTFNPFTQKKTHLGWYFINTRIYWLWLLLWLTWFFFMFFGFFYEGNLLYGAIFSLLALFILSLYVTRREVGSVWCWLINSFMVYYACYLLFYLPYRERYGNLL